MLLDYLTELKKSLSNEDFSKFILDVENDIKVDRVAFGRKTSQLEFINICEILKVVLMRCNNGQEFITE